MINDVAKKHKKIRTKRRVRKGFTVAAILCLILLACPAIAFAVSPTFRLNVMELVSNWQDDHVSIRIEESASTDWLPEGFVLVNEEITESITYRQYTNNDQFINLRIYTKQADINIDNENNIQDVYKRQMAARSIYCLQRTGCPDHLRYTRSSHC